MTNYQTEIPEYFEIGKDLETYTCEEELIEKIRYYLLHEEERCAIARNGYEKAKDKYSLQYRIRDLLKMAEIGDKWKNEYKGIRNTLFYYRYRWV